MKLTDEELEAKFDEIFKHCESKIEKIDEEMKYSMKQLNRFENHCLKILNSTEETMLELVFSNFKRNEINEDVFTSIRKYLEVNNFETFERYKNVEDSSFNFHQFEREHKIHIKLIKEQGETENPLNSSFEVINCSALDGLLDYVIGEFKSHRMKFPKKKKEEEPVMGRCRDVELKDIRRQYSRSQYLLDLVIFGVDYYYRRSKTKMDQCLQGIDYAGEFRRNYYDNLLTSYKDQYKGLANGEKLFNILQIVGRKIVANKADTHLDRLFEMKVDQEMENFETNKDIIKLIQIEFVKESRSNNLLSGTEKERLDRELLLKVLHFGYNLKDEVLSFVVNSIERCKNKSSFVREMNSMIRGKYSSSMGEIKDLVLSSSSSLEELTKTLSDYFGDNEVAKSQLKGFLNNLKSSEEGQSNVMMKESEMEMEASLVDKLKELFHSKERFDIENDMVSQMFDEVNILNEDNVKEKYKVKYEFCGVACFKCSVPCTESVGHDLKKVPHNANYHISNTLLGIANFIYINYIRPVMISL